MKMSEAMSYSAKDIQVLEGLEAVRKRPSMFIGVLSRGSIILRGQVSCLVDRRGSCSRVRDR